MTDNISAGYDFPCFASADAGVFILNTAYMMVGNIEKLNFILAILNSLLGRFLTKTYTLQLGNRQFRMLHQYVQHFPLPLFEKDNQLHKDCLNLVSLITTEKDKNLRQSLLSKLNSIIYNIFSFDKIEIELLNNVNN